MRDLMRAITILGAACAGALTFSACDVQNPAEPSSPSTTIASPSRAAVGGYTVVDLGTLGGGPVRASAINPAGQIVGGAMTTVDLVGHAVLWSKGSLADLGTLGGSSSSALAINPRGQV